MPISSIAENLYEYVKAFRKDTTYCNFEDAIRGPDLINYFRRVTIDTVSDILLLVAREKECVAQSINVLIKFFFEALKEMVPYLNWEDVLLLMDRPNFWVSNQFSFINYCTCMMVMFIEHPLEYINRKWKYQDAQMSLILSCLEYPSACSFGGNYRTIDMMFLVEAPKRINLANIWKCLDFYSTILRLYDENPDNRQHIIPHFERAMMVCPDYILCGLLQVDVQSEIKDLVLCKLIQSHIGSSCKDLAIMGYAWSRPTKNIVFLALSKHYASGNDIHLIFEILQVVKAFPEILYRPPTELIIHLAFHYFKEEHGMLKDFMQSRISFFLDSFFHEWILLIFKVSGLSSLSYANQSSMSRTMVLCNCQVLVSCMKESGYYIKHESEILNVEMILESHIKDIARRAP